MSKFSIGDVVQIKGTVIDTTDDSFHTHPQVNVQFSNGQYPRWIDADILEKVETEFLYNREQIEAARQREIKEKEEAFRSEYEGTFDGKDKYFGIRAQVLREEWKPENPEFEIWYYVTLDNKVTLDIGKHPYPNKLAYAPTQALAEEIVAIREGRWKYKKGDRIYWSMGSDMDSIIAEHDWSSNHYNQIPAFPSIKQCEAFIASRTETAQVKPEEAEADESPYRVLIDPREKWRNGTNYGKTSLTLEELAGKLRPYLGAPYAPPCTEWARMKPIDALRQFKAQQIPYSDKSTKGAQG